MNRQDIEKLKNKIEKYYWKNDQRISVSTYYAMYGDKRDSGFEIYLWDKKANVGETYLFQIKNYNEFYTVIENPDRAPSNLWDGCRVSYAPDFINGEYGFVFCLAKFDGITKEDILKALSKFIRDELGLWLIFNFEWVEQKEDFLIEESSIKISEQSFNWFKNVLKASPKKIKKLYRELLIAKEKCPEPDKTGISCSQGVACDACHLNKDFIQQEKRCPDCLIKANCPYNQLFDGECGAFQFKYCTHFDGGLCYNKEEFPNGVPTEISSVYCDNECKYHKRQNNITVSGICNYGTNCDDCGYKNEGCGSFPGEHI
jgi:hypothetical protein